MAPDGLVFTDGRGGAVWGSLACLLAQTAVVSMSSGVTGALV